VYLRAAPAEFRVVRQRLLPVWETALVTAFALALLAAAQTDSLGIHYVGNAGFELWDGSATLLVDLPYQSGAFDLMEYDPASISVRGRTLAVITHGHSDHFDPSLLQNDWEVYGPSEVTALLATDRPLSGDEQTFGAFAIRRFLTPHHGTEEHYSYLVTWRGRRIYFPGDTEDPTHLMSMTDIDVLFITPWLSCAIARRGGVLRADTIVLHHQFPDDRLDVCGDPMVVPQVGDQGLCT
jgi:hypothetical protein